MVFSVVSAAQLLGKYPKGTESTVGSSVPTQRQDS